ncbi:MAG: phosphate signaling complex protein PhoU [Parvularcula sp.]|jgi:phosphate transport system protein|nr:phosphate signaling complex protein PhoU [Parvularcula sp.]
MKHAVIDRPHTVSSFDGELAEVKSLVNRMAGLAQRSLEEAIVALESADRAAAYEIVAKDKVIDELELSIERLVLLTITSHAPMAEDLRFLIVAIRVGKMLERTGDQAKRIARRIKKLGPDGPDEIGHSLILIRAMTKYANDMIETAIKSFQGANQAAAQEVLRADAELNEMHDKLARICAEEMAAGTLRIGHGIEITLIGKQLERVGDYATNIAGDVLYMVTGSRDNLCQ